MAHPDGLPDAPNHAWPTPHDRKTHASAAVQEPPRKPSNWWAFEREPWKRVNAEIMAKEKAEGRARPGVDL